MAPPDRLEPVYKKDERTCIDPHKTEYLKATSPAARKSIVQAQILPSLFEYWARIGQEVPDEKMAEKRDVSFLCFAIFCFAIIFRLLNVKHRNFCHGFGITGVSRKSNHN